MYKLTIKGQVMTIPKENIVLLAMTKQVEKGLPLSRTVEDAISFFKRNNIAVEEV